MNALITYFKDLLSTETARVTAWGGTALVAGAVALAGALGINLPQGVIDAIGVIGVFTVTEIIRHFVYAPATVALIAQASAPADNPTQTLSADESPAAQ